MQEQPFIGVGHNPQGKDLPLGLGFRLAQDAEAMGQYTGLTQVQRDRIVDYIQACVTGEDAERRIQSVIDGLRAGQISF